MTNTIPTVRSAEISMDIFAISFPAVARSIVFNVHLCRNAVTYFWKVIYRIVQEHVLNVLLGSPRIHLLFGICFCLLVLLHHYVSGSSFHFCEVIVNEMMSATACFSVIEIDLLGSTVVLKNILENRMHKQSCHTM